MTYTIFGGVNGAGKTTLYELFSKGEQKDFGERINVDDITSSIGNWDDEKTQIIAARQSVKNIKKCLEKQISFNQESTLSGRSIIQTIKKAKSLGFSIQLFYVYVDSIETAKQRVADRIQRGGHGVSGDLIEKRFTNSIISLKEIIPLCDKADIFYNDTNEGIIHMASVENGAATYKSASLHGFIHDVMPTDLGDGNIASWR